MSFVQMFIKEIESEMEKKEKKKKLKISSQEGKKGEIERDNR